MTKDLSRALTDAVIRRLAGAQSYERGLDYFRQGQVESLAEMTGQVYAMVRGSRDYNVTLASDEGVLDYACDCPIGSEGSFCKHCVATALAWLQRSAEPAKSSGRAKAKELTLDDAAKILQTEDKETLVRMLLEWAKDDSRMRERMLLYAARRSGPETGVAAVWRAYQNAVRVRGYVHYREATGWARGVDDAIDSIGKLLDDGHAAAVIELCESALASLLRAIEGVDDSDGHFGGLRDHLEDLHYRACQEARPDPAELAKRLFQWELRSDFDVFHGAVSRYHEILGDKGMQVYRKLAEAEWKKVPARSAKDRGSEWGKHFRITHIMESLARLSGDVEQLVNVMSRDLSNAYDYLQIAEVYREARQYDKALLWAENGLKTFPEHTDLRLREFAAQEYHRRRRHEEAMQLVWAEFAEHPYLESYKTLQRHAQKARAWPQWRERALAEIRLRIPKSKENPRNGNQPCSMPPGGGSLLVEIFLYENNTEAAWQEAQQGGCSHRLWLELAAVREKEHPEDAAPIYLRQATAAVATTNNGRYEDSVKLLVKAAAVMKRIDRSTDFERELETLRVRYKIKRNFIKLLNEKEKALYLS